MLPGNMLPWCKRGLTGGATILKMGYKMGVHLSQMKSKTIKTLSNKFVWGKKAAWEATAELPQHHIL